MKNLTKIGRASSLNLRTIKRDETVAVSFEVGGERFSATFSPQNFELEEGDLVKVKYEKEGFLNKIVSFETLAKNSENASKSAKILNVLAFIWYALLSVFIAGGIAFSLFVDTVKFDFSDIAAFIFLCVIGYLAVCSAMDKFRVLRHFL